MKFRVKSGSIYKNRVVWGSGLRIVDRKWTLEASVSLFFELHRVRGLGPMIRRLKMLSVLGPSFLLIEEGGIEWSGFWLLASQVLRFGHEGREVHVDEGEAVGGETM